MDTLLQVTSNIFSPGVLANEFVPIFRAKNPNVLISIRDLADAGKYHFMIGFQLTVLKSYQTKQDNL